MRAALTSAFAQPWQASPADRRTSCSRRDWRGWSSSLSCRCITWRRRRCRRGSLELGYTFDWAWSNYSNAITTYHTEFLRSLEYAGIATLIALAVSYPLAYWIAFRGRALEEPLPAAGDRAVLRDLSGSHAGLADDPRRRRAGCRDPARPARARARRPAAGHIGGGDRRDHLQLPSLHGAAALREPGAGRRAAARRGQRPLRQSACGRSCA